MTYPNGTIRPILVTTASDSDDKFCLDQPLQVIFDKAQREVGANEIRISSRSSTTMSIGRPVAEEHCRTFAKET